MMTRAAWVLFIALAAGAGQAVAANLPAGTTDVVVMAHDTVVFDDFGEIASGQVVVNEPTGVALVRRTFKGLADTQLIADNIVVRAGKRTAPLFFDVFANVYSAPNGATISDSGPTPFSLPLFTFPTAVTVVPGTDNCPTPHRIAGDCRVLQKDGPITLQPGSYNRLTVGPRAAVYLAGGTYNFKSITTSYHASLLANAPVVINVQKRASFGFFTTFGPTAPETLNGRCIIMNVAGDRVRFLAGEAHASIVAPDASMMLGPLGVYTGNFFAKTVRVRPFSVLGAAPALPACP